MYTHECEQLILLEPLLDACPLRREHLSRIRNRQRRPRLYACCDLAHGLVRQLRAIGPSPIAFAAS